MFKHFRRFITTLSFVILYTSISFSLHIIGGDVIYECKGIDVAKNEVSFKITFTMYRDSKSNGAQFDNDARFGIYRGSGNNWTWIRTIDNISPSSVEEIPIEGANPCIIVPVNVGVQRGIYVFDVKLPISNQSYMISYQRCCRNNLDSN